MNLPKIAEAPTSAELRRRVLEQKARQNGHAELEGKPKPKQEPRA